MANTVKKSDLAKHLDKLENVSKAQLFHTPSNSDPGQWAGSVAEDVDSMDENAIANGGTDYEGVRKSLGLKVEKSLPLTPAEVAIVKGEDPHAAITEKMRKGEALTGAEKWAIVKSFRGLSKAASEGSVGAKQAPDTNAGADDVTDKEPEVAKGFDGLDEKEAKKDEKEKDKDMEKSLMGALNVINANLQKSLDILVGRIEALEGNLGKGLGHLDSLGKSTADSIVAIGRVVEGTADQVQKSARMPVRGPQAVQSQGSSVIEKSFGTDVDQPLTKSQISDALVDLVTKGQISSAEVYRFEASGQLSPSVQQKLLGRK